MAIPRPFRRDSIELVQHGRAWRESVRADQLSEGDTIAQLGRVHGIRIAPDGQVMLAVGEHDGTLAVAPNRTFRAFVRVDQ
jgi:hypothetical protein